MDGISTETLGARRIEEAKKIEISIERIAIWTLVFTNAFFICYFLGRLFRLI
jgi:hypothetical protein